MKEGKEKRLNIREDKISGIYVEGLTEYVVENVFDCVSLLKKGEKLRKIGQTRKNEMSSRSHTIFTLLFESGKVFKNGVVKVNFLNKQISLNLKRDRSCIYVTWQDRKNMISKIIINPFILVKW